jgi:hypothetical protein
MTDNNALKESVQKREDLIQAYSQEIDALKNEIENRNARIDRLQAAMVAVAGELEDFQRSQQTDVGCDNSTSSVAENAQATDDGSCVPEVENGADHNNENTEQAETATSQIVDTVETPTSFFKIHWQNCAYDMLIQSRTAHAIAHKLAEEHNIRNIGTQTILDWLSYNCRKGNLKRVARATYVRSEDDNAPLIGTKKRPPTIIVDGQTWKEVALNLLDKPKTSAQLGKQLNKIGFPKFSQSTVRSYLYELQRTSKVVCIATDIYVLAEAYIPEMQSTIRYGENNKVRRDCGGRLIWESVNRHIFAFLKECRDNNHKVQSLFRIQKYLTRKLTGYRGQSIESLQANLNKLARCSNKDSGKTPIVRVKRRKKYYLRDGFDETGAFVGNEESISF